MSAAVTGIRRPEPTKIVLPSSYGVPNIPFEFDNHVSITIKVICVFYSLLIFHIISSMVQINYGSNSKRLNIIWMFF